MGLITSAMVETWYIIGFMNFKFVFVVLSPSLFVIQISTYDTRSLLRLSGTPSDDTDVER